MRIDELCLDAFGPFSDRRLLLCDEPGAEGRGGDAGLCLVYGPNEAGKSSALRAIRGLLYGIEHDSRDNFVHAHADLRVAARLRFADGFEARLVRRKGRKQTLTGEGARGEEAVRRLTALTEAVPEALFRHLYGLDHPALVEGSAQLLEDGGELSRALFGAGLGIVHLRKVIEALDAEAASLFVPRGKNQRIAVALAEWKELQNEIRATTLEPSRFDEQARRTRELERESVELDEAIAASQLELARVRRRRDAGIALAQAQEAREQVRSRIEREGERAAALVVDRALLAAREPIELLHQRLGNYRDALDQLPRREESLAALAREVSVLEALLGAELGAAAEPVLRRIVDRTPRVRARIAERARLQDRLEKAAEAEREACRELARLQAGEGRGQGEVGGSEPDLAPLEQAQKRAQRLGAIDDEIDETTRAIAALDGEIARTRERLGLAAIADEALEALPIPGRESIERHARARAELRDAWSRRRQERLARAEERRTVREELDRLGGEAGLPSESELLALRATRDGLWRGLRGRLGSGARRGDPAADRAVEAMTASVADVERVTAEFEVALAGADRLADRLRGEADRVARGAELVVRTRRLDETLAELDRELAEIEAEGERVAAAWRRDWPEALGEPGLPDARIAWRGELDRLLERIAARRGATERRARLREQRQAVCEGLRRALAEADGRLGGRSPVDDAGADEALWPWLERAERAHALALEQRTRRRDAAQALAQAERQLERATQATRQAADEVDRAEADWQAERIALVLPEATRPDEADAHLDAVASLLARRREVEDLRRRVELMGRSVATFEADCAALVARHRPALAELTADAAALRLKRDLDEAREQSTLAEAIAGALAEAHHELAGIERRLEQQRTEQRARVEEDGESEAEDPDRSAVRIAQLEARLQERQQERVRCAEVLSLERAALAAMDGNARIAELAERAESRLASVRGDVVRYAELRLARQILEQEIEAYRRENQGPLLEEAGRLFAELTLDAYPTIHSEPGEDGRARLVAVSRAGKERFVDALSSGTRDQLFLALRLAALSTSIARAEPMPLVADDILIEFDDERSRATLDVLARVGLRTQILLFTHHRHVVDQAAALGARARIVEL